MVDNWLTPSAITDDEYERRLYGNRVGVLGKILGNLGLDASGERRAQPWYNALLFSPTPRPLPPLALA